MKYLGKTVTSLILMTQALLLAGVAIADNTKIKKDSVYAQKSTDWSSGGTKQQLDFKFGAAKASLRQDGVIQFEGTVSHMGLRCATYSAGIQFGKGNPRCTDVEWITEPVYLTSQKHCNNAELVHTGADKDAKAAERFDDITCGQYLLKCVGTCK